MTTAALFDEVSPPMTGTALFSPCERYRYTLTRHWSQTNTSVCISIGLNPSTATAEIPDPTITRDIGFAKRLGCGWFVKLNLFGWRDTEPLGLLTTPDPIGPQNDGMLRSYARLPNATVIAAWGSHRKSKALASLVERRAAHVRQLFIDEGVGLFCFGLNADKQPKHSLYLRADTPLQVFP